MSEKLPEPAIPFSQGYVRPTETTAKLLSALVKAMARHPTLRVGQLIYAALEAARPTMNSHEGAVARMENFHSYLFNVYDEELTKALEAF